ncbi:MAG: hypothetical protein WCD86_03560 [Ktedonobacteraceae bacterium]
MEQVGWQLILLLATIIAALVAAIILGTTHVIGFNWIILILVGIIFAIMIFCVWYTFRTRQKSQEQYNEDIADIRKDVLSFKEDIRQMREKETHDWHEWAVSFSQQVAKEHKDHTEELKQQCMEAIHDAENRMDSNIKNAQTIFSGAVDSYNRAVDLYGQQLIYAQKQMEALEERLRKELTPPENPV